MKSGCWSKQNIKARDVRYQEGFSQFLSQYTVVHSKLQVGKQRLVRYHCKPSQIGRFWCCLWGACTAAVAKQNTGWLQPAAKRFAHSGHPIRLTDSIATHLASIWECLKLELIVEGLWCHWPWKIEILSTLVGYHVISYVESAQWEGILTNQDATLMQNTHDLGFVLHSLWASEALRNRRNAFRIISSTLPNLLIRWCDSRAKTMNINEHKHAHCWSQMFVCPNAWLIWWQPWHLKSETVTLHWFNWFNGSPWKV